MKKLRWQLLILILALAAIAILLLGQQPSVQPVDTISEQPQPVSGGVYSEALIGSPARFNPVLDFFNPVDRDIDRLLYSSLVKFDARGLPQPDLAESWGISQDGTVYNFSLREDAVWHDGQPVTAGDVVFTIELLRDPALPVPEDLREFWSEIEVEALDDKLLQIRLPEPFAPFLDYLTFGVLPDHLLADVDPEAIIDHDFNLQPVGSGPYRFDQFLVEDEQITGVSLRAFEDYYGQRAFIDDVVFRFYPDAPAALAAYQQGEVMGISRVTPDILPDVLAEPGLNLFTGRLPQLTLILFNLDNPETPFFQEREVRRALMQALNRQRMIDRLFQGQAILANGPIFPGTWAFLDTSSDLPAYDQQAAVDTLKAAEYTIPAEGGNVRAKEDVFLAFTLLYPADMGYTALAQAIQDSWAQIGVEVTLEEVPYDELISDYLDPRQYQAALVDLNLSRSPDPDPYPFWHQAQITGGQNYAQWDDRPASEYLEQARITFDLGERTRLYRNFQVRFARELPALPLFYPVYSYAVSAEVQGISIGPLFDPSDRLATLPEWYLRAATGETTESP